MLALHAFAVALFLAAGRGDLLIAGNDATPVSALILTSALLRCERQEGAFGWHSAVFFECDLVKDFDRKLNLAGRSGRSADLSEARARKGVSGKPHVDDVEEVEEL